jgi:hypothetical protein
LPKIRVSILRGLSLLDLAGTVDIAVDALADEDHLVCLTAVHACVAGGEPWSDVLLEAAVAWMADGEVIRHFSWSHDHPFCDLVDVLLDRGETAAVTSLLAEGLTRPVAAMTKQGPSRWAVGPREPVMWAVSTAADRVSGSAARRGGRARRCGRRRRLEQGRGPGFGSLGPDW